MSINIDKWPLKKVDIQHIYKVVHGQPIVSLCEEYRWKIENKITNASLNLVSSGFEPLSRDGHHKDKNNKMITRFRLLERKKFSNKSISIVYVLSCKIILLCH